MNSQELLKELIWFDTKKCFINGAWKKPVSKQYIDLFDPSDNSPICKIPRSNKSDVNLAVQSAQNSLSSNWGSFSSLERGRILNKIGLLVQDKIDKLAKIESLDVGKPLTQSKADASALARYCLLYTSPSPRDPT